MSFPEHILVINVFFSPYSYGGATIVAEEVAKELVRSGRRVTAISGFSREDIMPYTVMRTEKSGIENYLINLPRKRSYEEIHSNARVTEIVARLIDQFEPDIVHAHCIQDIGTGILPMIRCKGLPLVLSIHDYWWICERQFMIMPNQRYCAQDPVRIENCRSCVDDWSRAKLRFEALQRDAAAADLITYPSRFALDLSVRSGLKCARQKVWPNGVRPPKPEFFELQAKRRQKDARFVFGYAGGPTHIKGWQVIRAAFEQLKRDDFIGILVDGSMGSIGGKWWSARKRYSRMMGEWVVVPRYAQEEMDDFYSKIDVLLFMSQWKETFGLGIREALSRGIRVLQTDSGGASEWEGASKGDMLQIGDGPELLAERIEAELDRPVRGVEPHAVISHAEQASTFLELVQAISPTRA